MNLETTSLFTCETQEIVGLHAPPFDPDHVFITVQSVGVHKYNIHSSKCVESWLFGPSNHFIHHAVLQPITKSLFAAVDNSYLIRWNQSDNQIKNLNRFYISSWEDSSVHDICTHVLLEKFVAITSKNGTLSLYSDGDVPLHSTTPETTHPSQTILSSTTCHLENETLTFFLTLRLPVSKSEYTVSLHSVEWLNKSTLTNTSVIRAQVRTNTKPIVASYEPRRKVLFVIWDDGIAQFHTLDKNNNCFTPMASFLLNAPIETVIASSASEHVLMASTDRSKVSLTIWNPIYCVTSKIYQFFLVNDKSPLRSIHYAENDGMTLMSFTHTVLVSFLRLPSPSLSMVLGSFLEMQNLLVRDANMANPPPLLGIDNRDPLTPGPQFNLLADVSMGRIHDNRCLDVSEFSRNSEMLEDEARAIAALTDRSKTPDYTSFMKVFNDYIISRTGKIRGLMPPVPINRLIKSDLPLPKYAQDANGFQGLITMFLSTMEAQAIFTPKFSITVAKRCLNEKFLWKPLKMLITSNSLSRQSIPNLLTTLMEQQQLDLVATALTCISDVSESDLIKVLKWLFNDVQPMSLQLFVDESGTPAPSPFSPLHKYLNIVLSASFSPHFLRPHIRLLSIKDTIKLLKYAMCYFASHLECTQPLGMPFSPPPLNNVIQWISLVIDSRIKELIPLSHRYSTLLKKLHSSLNSIITFYNELELLKGTLAYLSSHGKYRTETISEYTAEFLAI